jgi:hypothetical protein
LPALKVSTTTFFGAVELFAATTYSTSSASAIRLKA